VEEYRSLARIEARSEHLHDRNEVAKFCIPQLRRWLYDQIDQIDNNDLDPRVQVEKKGMTLSMFPDRRFIWTSYLEAYESSEGRRMWRHLVQSTRGGSFTDDVTDGTFIGWWFNIEAEKFVIKGSPPVEWALEARGRSVFVPLLPNGDVTLFLTNDVQLRLHRDDNNAIIIRDEIYTRKQVLDPIVPLDAPYPRDDYEEDAMKHGKNQNPLGGESSSKKPPKTPKSASGVLEARTTQTRW